MKDNARIQRAANALQEVARQSGSGSCPSWWTGPWRNWYRLVAETALNAADAGDDLPAIDIKNAVQW